MGTLTGRPEERTARSQDRGSPPYDLEICTREMHLQGRIAPAQKIPYIGPNRERIPRHGHSQALHGLSPMPNGACAQGEYWQRIGAHHEDHWAAGGFRQHSPQAVHGDSSLIGTGDEVIASLIRAAATASSLPIFEGQGS